MKVPVVFASFANPVFIEGKNFGQKIELKRYHTLPNFGMEYDYETQFLNVSYQNAVARFRNFEYFIEGQKAQEVVKAQEEEKRRGRPPGNSKIQAQVSTPMGHVFSESPGLTGIGQKVK